VAVQRLEVVCWCCGKPAPHTLTQFLGRLGWAVRRVQLLPSKPTEPELYCPECFHEWGWPDRQGLADYIPSTK